MAQHIRSVRVDGDVVRIPLTRGEWAEVDVRDLAVVEGRNWTTKINGRSVYAVTRSDAPGVPGRHIKLLHREVMGLERGDSRHIDHIDGDGLNNRRSNLRFVTRQQNQTNGRSHRDATSQFKGVGWYKRDGTWQAQIRINGRYRFLGRFDSEIEAARVYDAAAHEAWGEFAHLNFPEEMQG